METWNQTRNGELSSTLPIFFYLQGNNMVMFVYKCFINSIPLVIIELTKMF